MQIVPENGNDAYTKRAREDKLSTILASRQIVVKKLMASKKEMVCRLYRSDDEPGLLNILTVSIA